MFDIGWTELLIIGVVAIVVVGPKELPRAFRTLGQWMGKAKRMASEFQGQFTEAIREAELDAVKRDLESIASVDPVSEVRAAAAKTGEDIRGDLDRSTSSTGAKPYSWDRKASWEVDETPAAAAPPTAPVAPAAPPSQPSPVETKP